MIMRMLVTAAVAWKLKAPLSSISSMAKSRCV
jgi:hypothetical protein